MSAFDDVRLPEDIEKGSSGGPQFFTSVVRLASGAEARNQNWVYARGLYDISYGIDPVTAPLVAAFFRSRRGRLRGFRFKDWSDYAAEDQTPTGVIDGVNKTFKLAKTYSDGYTTYVRPITRPVHDTLVIAVNNAVTGDYALNDKGVIVFNTAPPVGSVIKCAFEFDVPVRFDNDHLSLRMETATALSVGSINLLEIIE